MTFRSASMLGGVTLLYLAGKAGAAAINFQPGDPQQLADPSYGPQVGKDTLWIDYKGKEPPFPGNVPDPILPTADGPPGVDDVVWQNLLAAEWVIYDYYQQGAELFNTSSFTDIGFSNYTYDLLLEIRNAEAGHLRLFQNQISPTSIKPGRCKYQYPFYDALSYLALATVLEISSMAFLTGLVQTAELPASHAAMLAIAETESRHETWQLLGLWQANPFAGPSDTIYPYPDQILDPTNDFIVPGSCPSANPLYPNPSQHLPALAPANGSPSLQPGATVNFNFTDPENQPEFKAGQDYYMTFFHGPTNISVPIDVSSFPQKPVQVQIPQLEPRGVFIAVVTDTEGAPTAESVIAGPSFLLLQPAWLGLALLV